jgi:hypothetical protein
MHPCALLNTINQFPRKSRCIGDLLILLLGACGTTTLRQLLACGNVRLLSVHDYVRIGISWICCKYHELLLNRLRFLQGKYWTIIFINLLFLYNLHRKGIMSTRIYMYSLIYMRTFLYAFIIWGYRWRKWSTPSFLPLENTTINALLYPLSNIYWLLPFSSSYNTYSLIDSGFPRSLVDLFEHEWCS